MLATSRVDGVKEPFDVVKPCPATRVPATPPRLQLRRMMLAGTPVQVEAIAELADTVRATGADAVADRLEGAADFNP